MIKGISVFCLLLLFLLPAAALGGDKTEMPKLKFSAKDAEFIVVLYDNVTTRNFLTLLPLTLTFEDFAGAEKTGHRRFSERFCSVPWRFNALRPVGKPRLFLQRRRIFERPCKLGAYRIRHRKTREYVRQLRAARCSFLQHFVYEFTSTFVEIHM